MKKLVVSTLLFVCMFMFGCAKEQVQTVVATVNGVELSSAEFDNNLERVVNVVKNQNPQALQQPFPCAM